MFEGLKSKLKKKDDQKVFVNPYTSPKSSVFPMSPTLNPYVTDYKTKTSKTLLELIKGYFKKEEPEPISPFKSQIPLQPIYEEPTFIADMKSIMVSDLMWIARRKKESEPLTAVEPVDLYEDI